MSLYASSLGSALFIVIALGIFWPIPLSYALYMMTKNTKATTILTLTATITALFFSLTTPYALNISVYGAVISLGLAGFIWMYEEAK